MLEEIGTELGKKVDWEERLQKRDDYKALPTKVHALEGKHITQVQCGIRYTMALTSKPKSHDHAIVL